MPHLVAPQFTQLFLTQRDEHAPSTLSTCHAITKAMLNACVRARLILANPLDRAIAPKAPGKASAMRTWDAAQTASFLRFTAFEPDAAAWRFFLLLAMRR